MASFEQAEKTIHYYVFVDLDEGRCRLRVATSATSDREFKIDEFDYPSGASQVELLKEAKWRNSPLRIRYPDGGLGHESFQATSDDLLNACMLCRSLAQAGSRWIRLVSRQDVVLKSWNAPDSPQ